jgi:antigen 43
MTTYVISAGQTSTGIVLSSGDSEIVRSGGTAISTTISNGGVAFISSGGVASGAFVGLSGAQNVSSGGVARGTVIDGGYQTVSSGAASGTIVSSGFEEVFSGGIDVSTIVRGGGNEYISGGVASGTTVSSGGRDVVFSGGSVSGAVVSSGGLEYVFSSGTAISTIVSSGGVEFAFSGGTAISTIVSGGAEYVYSSGTASGTIISSGGVEYVYSGGAAIGTIISSGGVEYVYSGGAAIGTIVSSGGTQYVYSSGTASGTIVSSGGFEVVSSGGVAISTVVSSGGVEVLSSGGVASLTALDVGGTIDVSYLPFRSGGTVSLNSGTDVLTVSEGGHTYTQQLSGSYAGDTFHLSSDAGSGTDITVMPCFAAGTRIATERGEMPVELLNVGDAVRTVLGELRPIVWIGQRDVDCARHPRPEHVWPVRVLAHAFGPGLPARDLLLSPDHSLYIDGVLIPVQHLVNGTVIVQEPRERIHYFHVELPRHDVLLAEGLPAETYLDTGNRHAFANGAAHMMLHPEFEPLDWYDDACAPLCQRGPKLTAARRALFAEAERRGWRVVGSTDLQVEIGERSLSAARVKGKLHQFLLPSGTRELRIVSHPGVPAELDPGVDDRRRLGARIGAVFVDGKVLPLEHAALAAGFHPPECSGGERWRWTDGAALLRLPAPLPRPATLELLVRDTMRHWQCAGAAERSAPRVRAA